MRFNVAMDTDCIDIGEYLPFANNSQIRRFMNLEDGNLPKRKMALYKHLFGALDLKSHQAFRDSLCRILFDRSYLSHHRWPHAR